MNEPEVLLDLKDSVAILTLNRPKVLNALSRSLQLTLEKYILQLENDDKVNCIIITGAGEKAFSAGGDIHEMDKLSKLNKPSPDHPEQKPLQSSNYSKPEQMVSGYTTWLLFEN